MRKIIRRLRTRAEEKGAVLPFVALVLVVLMGMAAFAIDLGWLYLQGSRIQRAADASALAGVIHLPANTPQVNAQTVNGANANGWNVGELNGNDIGPGPDSLAWTPLADNRLQVELTSTVNTFFMRVFGINEVTMTRRATAEYIKPVPLGSPSACFGISGYLANFSPSDPQSLESQGLGHCKSFTMNFWAAINGRRTAKEHGDPYAVSHQAWNNLTTGGCVGTIGAENDDYRSNGYYYGIEVPAGVTTFDVRVFDAGFYERGSPQTETGDFQNLRCSHTAGPTTEYRLFRPDETPLDPADNSNLACGATSLASEASGSNNTRNRWRSICQVTTDTQGIFILNVRTSGNGGGNNSYSIGVTTNGGNARVYAINDMSIFTNSGGASEATVYLAEVDENHRGKTLVLDFYDPGENTGNAWVEVKMPNGVTPTCDWSSRDDDGNSTGGASGVSCLLQSTISGNPQFNAQWLTATVHIPNDYTCSATCFWTMRLQLGTTSQDRTTWAARVIGNPVRLTPNDP